MSTESGISRVQGFLEFSSGISRGMPIFLRNIDYSLSVLVRKTKIYTNMLNEKHEDKIL